MSFIVAVLISIAAGMERCTGRKLFAMALAVAAIVALSLA
jgi:hypothetical protein